MGKIVKRKVICRKKGYLYYVDAGGNLHEARMKHAKKKRPTAKKKRAKRCR